MPVAADIYVVQMVPYAYAGQYTLAFAPGKQNALAKLKYETMTR